MAHDFSLQGDSPLGYWHQRLGFPPEVDGRRTPNAFRKQVIQAFLRGAENIRRNMPDEGFNRVLCGIAMPRIVYSDLTVFFSEDYFSNFFNRKSCRDAFVVRSGANYCPSAVCSESGGCKFQTGSTRSGYGRFMMRATG